MQREHLRAQTLTALAQLTDISLQQRSLADAQVYAMRQLTLDPLRESAHRQLLHSLIRRGLLGDAKRHYVQMEQLLHTELGVAPAPETEELLRQIRQGSAATGAATVAMTDVLEVEETIGPVVPAAPSASASAKPRQFLGDAPLHGPFFGREYELSRVYGIGCSMSTAAWSPSWGWAAWARAP